LTNHCTNKCDFCIKERSNADFQITDLTFDREPSLDDILFEVSTLNLNQYKEIVFCGYGEPTCRLYDMLTICKRIRELTTTPIRVNTNGHASLILGEDTAPLFKGLVDCVSISLNAADSDTYVSLCHPKFGEDAYVGVLKFAREIIKYVPEVYLTVNGEAISDADIARCAEIAANIGAKFLVRDGIITV
jgi:TatD family-associated radical SAM protein